ncbi:uncharacterized protein LOC131858260 [Cryptomeria japonica]|uniref:uncharacterized protein LOC131858260 n=1 Tax=Cryptomeria japonica TaxID=3369 RepID=UPI0027DAB1E3|nr:uncharacterized protein LOC131858260 [Cryptomeria japonica]
MEAVEPRTIWLMPMGYEVDGNTLDSYAQHLLKKLVDGKEERSNTYKEDLDLHNKFTEPGRKRKVRKEVEELAKQIGITKEVVQRDREQTILKGEDMVKPKKTKPLSTSPKPSKPGKTNSAPTSSAQKPVPPPKPQRKSTGGVEKGKKENPQREYVVATTKDVETDNDEAIKALIDLSSMILKGLYDILDARRHTTSLEDERIKEYILVNLSSVISKAEVDRLLKLAKDIFKRKRRVNKIMYRKIDEVVKETKAILKQFMKVHRYDKEQPSERAVLEKKKNEKTIVTNDNDTTKLDDFGEFEQDPLVISIDSEKEAEEIEIVDEGKGEIDAEKDEDVVKDASVEVVEKEKREEKDDQAPVTVARDTVADKGK